MNKNQTNGEYLAPEVEVIEIRNREVLCASGSNESYNSGSWEW